ncbi:unnamed protein product [Protopolystoma xenopodis]|uniref:Uncharacterized protein n=1 Tax=Protopolystoma xenopodis TaxID=117903 RepID=A0A448WNH6_9PLAT|nr:unnamed protein product [Protopolystoma xenopodis]
MSGHRNLLEAQPHTRTVRELGSFSSRRLRTVTVVPSSSEQMCADHRAQQHHIYLTHSVQGGGQAGENALLILKISKIFGSLFEGSFVMVEK